MCLEWESRDLYSRRKSGYTFCYTTILTADNLKLSSLCPWSSWKPLSPQSRSYLSTLLTLSLSMTWSLWSQPWWTRMGPWRRWMGRPFGHTRLGIWQSPSLNHRRPECKALVWQTKVWPRHFLCALFQVLTSWSVTSSYFYEISLIFNLFRRGHFYLRYPHIVGMWLWRQNSNWGFLFVDSFSKSLNQVPLRKLRDIISFWVFTKRASETRTLS